MAREHVRVERKELGPVVTGVQTGHLIVKLSSEWRGAPPRTGWKVALKDNGEVGVLVDVIGNVEKPYAVIKVTDRALLERIGAGSVLEALIPQLKPRRRGRHLRGRRVKEARGGKRQTRAKAGGGVSRGGPRRGMDRGRRPRRGSPGGGRRGAK